MALTWARNGSWALLVLAVGAAIVYALWVGKPEPLPAPPAKPAPVQVDVIPADPAVRALSVVTQGTVRPLREIKLVSQVAGRVESTSASFAEGGFFSEGDTLLKVEDVDYHFAIARAESQVAQARQKVAEEKGRALQARREWRELGSDEANALFLRKPQLASAEAALSAAEADLAAARLDLVRTAIAAPFNGRISVKHVDLGQYVAPGTVIAEIYDTDVAQVRLPLTGSQVALLDLPLSYDNQSPQGDQGAPVTLRAQFANRSWEWQGRIVRTDASIDVDSRLVNAVAEIERPFAKEPGSQRPPLSPGLFVNATITGRELSGVSLLPRSALRSDSSVMVVDSQQRARMRSVEVLRSTPRQVWIQGLKTGERVIVSEFSQALAGMEVSVKNVAGLAGGAH